MNSPLGSPLPPSDIVKDFHESLKDLHFNNRVEISTLTMVAKDNIDCALQISQVLENHIKTVAPPRKLPALYVLDSIVKNVGGPYTFHLEKNLYKTFIDVYTAVDNRTRPSLESLLATWQRPVEGSADPRPVFSPETTSAISRALEQAKAAAQQQHQKQGRTPAYRQQHALPPRPMTGPAAPAQWTTPHTNGMRYPPPSPVQNGPQYQGYHQPNGYPMYQQPQPYYQQPSQPVPSYHAPVSQPQQPYYYPPAQPQPFYPQQNPYPSDYSKISGDMERLIDNMKMKLATNIHDKSIQARLSAMLDLKNDMGRKWSSPMQWNEVKEKLEMLITQENTPPYDRPPYTRVAPTPNQYQPIVQNYPQPQATQSTNVPSTQSNLADLLASLSNARGSTPQGNASSSTPSAPPTTAANNIANMMGIAPTQVPNGIAKDNDLISSLVSSGLIPPATPNQHSHSRSNSVQQPQPHAPPPLATTAPTASVPPPTIKPSSTIPNDLSALLASLSGAKPANATGPSLSAPAVEITTASIKIPRPDLSSRRLYKAKPSQCMTCGRRFAATPEGKARKARHMDYHFRMNKRLVDVDLASRAAVCRAWLPSVREWISIREQDDADEILDDKIKPQANGGAAEINGVTKKENIIAYVRVPEQAAMDESAQNGQELNVCPICQEEFKSVWHDGAQEWVWMDAVKAGSRVYHASCYNEVKRDQERNKSSLLGKRKVEDNYETVKKSPKTA